MSTQNGEQRIYAITHAQKNEGVNPGLTEKGKADIKAVTKKLPWASVKNILIGTGTRFNDIFQAITEYIQMGQIESVKFTPLLGSADSGKMMETGFEVYLADGTLVKIGNYIGLIGTPGINLHEWLNSLPNNTVLCTGREFIGALGVKDAQAGQVYVLDYVSNGVLDSEGYKVTVMT